MPVGHSDTLGQVGQSFSINIEAAKAAPAAAYLGASVFGMPISDIVTIATGVYIVLQIILLIPRYVELVRSWRDKACRSVQDLSEPGQPDL